MSHLDPKHIAKLARIKLSEQELALLGPQLQKASETIERVKNYDTQNHPPLYNPLDDQGALLREDELQPDQALEQAAAALGLSKQAPYFEVPKVIE